MLKMSVFLCFF
uniref:Uncharacterized protein n=1 Tax=Anguilla anguilla TaxID=7936 RepID=A0A0E9SUT7_ANGAN